MIHLTAEDIANAINAKLVAGDGRRIVSAISTDTRSVVNGDLFVALRGELFDAHDFLDKAIAADAAALFVETLPEESGDVAVIQVSNTLLALQDLAAFIRRKTDLPTIGITGSNGKTSTKDFTRSVLSQTYKVNATLGNLNNHIGLPLTVLSLTDDHTVSVLEMGMNHAGEIEPLCKISQPTIGIITNVGTAHIEFLGSQDAIMKEKGALARSLPQGGKLIMPHDCYGVDSIRKSSAATTILVGGDHAIRAEDLDLGVDFAAFTLVMGDYSAPVRLPVSGEHMVTNALLAAAAGQVLGLTIEQIAAGLTGTELTSGRLRSYIYDDIHILDDTYNANPDSVKAALQTLATTADGRTIAVLGRMAELGNHAEVGYREVGELAAERDILLLTVGDEADAISDAAILVGGQVKHCPSIDAASTFLTEIAEPGDTILFKGSRAAGMERVMQTAFPEN